MKINNKIKIALISLLGSLPLVSASSVVSYFRAFDLFYLFVENVFGNILFSIFGLALIFFIICVISKMSQLSMTFLIGTFVMVMLIGYFGALAAVPTFIFSFIYFANAVINWVNAR